MNAAPLRVTSVPDASTDWDPSSVGACLDYMVMVSPAPSRKVGKIAIMVVQNRDKSCCIIFNDSNKDLIWGGTILIIFLEWFVQLGIIIVYNSSIYFDISVHFQFRLIWTLPPSTDTAVLLQFLRHIRKGAKKYFFNCSSTGQTVRPKSQCEQHRDSLQSGVEHTGRPSLGAFIPQCDSDGRYRPLQVSTGRWWSACLTDDFSFVMYNICNI